MNDEKFEVEINEISRYLPGITVNGYDPSKETYRDMLRLIAYDICAPKRLRQVARICEDYGIRVEYSVFECDLNEENFIQLWEELAQTIDPNTDIILAYRICSSCVRVIKSMGNITRPGKPLLYII